MVAATIGAMALLAGAHPGGHDVSYLGRAMNDGRRLATPSPIPANGVYSVRGYGYNNREWISRPITRDFAPALQWGAPGPAHYGAAEFDFSRVYVRQGAAMIVVSPWVALDTNGMKGVERARLDWLREMGYVGGVRTFRDWREMAAAEGVGDGAGAQVQTRGEPGQLRPGIDFHPAATIRVPDAMRRARPRFQVIRPVEEVAPMAQAGGDAKSDGV